MTDHLYTDAARLVRLETRVFGIEGRGGMVDEIDAIREDVQAVRRALARSAFAFASFALALVGAIVSHTV